MPHRGDRVRIDLAKGMDQRHIAENGPQRLTNVVWDPNYGWRTSAGYEGVSGNYSGGDAARVRSVHWFDQHHGARGWILYEIETGTPGNVQLRYVAPGVSGPGLTTSQAFGSRRMPPGPAQPTQYIDAHNGWCYLLSRYNPPIRFNGRVDYQANYAGLRRVGFDVLPPAPLVNTGASGLFNAFFTDTAWDFTYHPVYQMGLGEATALERTHWRYGWAISYVNDLGQESPVGPVAFESGFNEEWDDPASNTDYGGKASVVLTVPNPPENVRAIRVYRTRNLQTVQATGSRQDGFDTLYANGEANAPLYFRGEFMIAEEFHLTDDWPDELLGDELDRNRTGLWPETASMGVIHKHVMFVAGMTEEPATIRHSVPWLLEQMPEVNRIVAGGGAGYITALKSARNGVIVYRRSGIDVIRGDPQNGWFLEPLTDEVGHIGGPVVDIPELGQIFIGEDGFYLLELSEGRLERARWRYIGAKIRRQWLETVNLNAMVGAAACYLPWNREVWYQVPSEGSDLPILGYVYHVGIDGFSRRTSYSFSCMAAIRDHRRLMVAGSHGTGDDSGLMVYHDGIETIPSGDTVESNISIRIDAVQRTRFRQAEFLMVAQGRAFTPVFRRDRHLVSFDMNAANGENPLTVDSEFDRDRWGSARWGDPAIFDDYSRSIVVVDIDDQGGAFEALLVVTGTRLHMLGLDVFTERTTDVPKEPQ